MDWTLEVVVVPVSDTARAIGFYRDQVGFALDHHTVNEFMDFAQLTPRGSGCSIVVGSVPSPHTMEPGSLHGLQLVVADAAAAREELQSRGVEPGEITVLDERDGGTFFDFADPDGNTWAVQQLRARATKPLIPRDNPGGHAADHQGSGADPTGSAAERGGSPADQEGSGPDHHARPDAEDPGD